MDSIMQQRISKLALEKAKVTHDCFSFESTERYIKMFAGKRFDFYVDSNEPEWTTKATKEYRALYISVFYKVMLEIISRKKALAKEKAKLEKANKKSAK